MENKEPLDKILQRFTAAHDEYLEAATALGKKLYVDGVPKEVNKAIIEQNVDAWATKVTGDLQVAIEKKALT